MTNQSLTQELLKELLHYCPDTGIFTWVKNPSNKVNIGDEAGYLDARGYRKVMIKGKGYSAHRLAFMYIEGCFPPDQVDHINHIKSDNKWSNLRYATNDDNAKNKTIYKSNVSGVSGVYWYKLTNKWCAQIRVNDKRKHLGYFKNKTDAINAKKSAEAIYGFHENHGTI